MGAFLTESTSIAKVVSEVESCDDFIGRFDGLPAGFTGMLKNHLGFLEFIRWANRLQRIDTHAAYELRKLYDRKNWFKHNSSKLSQVLHLTNPMLFPAVNKETDELINEVFESDLRSIDTFLELIPILNAWGEELVGKVPYAMNRLDIILTDGRSSKRYRKAFKRALGEAVKRRGEVLLDSDSEEDIRKHGFGGPSVEHEKLKHHIFANPDIIGLQNVNMANSEVEYSFMSGDRVDILFQDENQEYVVVEIETTNPFPGAYQAVKYRALKCAEEGFPLNSPKVNAVLVAYDIPQTTKSFCRKYSIGYRAVKPSQLQ